MSTEKPTDGAGRLETYKALKSSGLGLLLEESINELGRVYVLPKDFVLAPEGSALAELKNRLCTTDVIKPLSDLFTLCRRVTSEEPFYNEDEMGELPLLSDIFGFDPRYIKGMWEGVLDAEFDEASEDTWLICAQGENGALEPPSFADYMNIHRVMVECVPSIYRPYKWTEPKDISKKWNDMENLADFGLGINEEACVLKLYMNGALPVLEVVAGKKKGSQADLGFADIWAERVTTLLNAPIKKVYFLIGNQAGYSSVIGRKNPDGEWTLTIL